MHQQYTIFVEINRWSKNTFFISEISWTKLDSYRFFHPCGRQKKIMKNGNVKSKKTETSNLLLRKLILEKPVARIGKVRSIGNLPWFRFHSWSCKCLNCSQEVFDEFNLSGISAELIWCINKIKIEVLNALRVIKMSMLSQKTTKSCLYYDSLLHKYLDDSNLK